MTGAKPTAGIVAEHEAETDQPEEDAAHADIHVVFHQHVDGVLAARHAAFEQGKPRLHEENQSRADG